MGMGWRWGKFYGDGVGMGLIFLTVSCSTLNDGLHNLRGHRYKLFKDRSCMNVRKFFFSQRVVDSWNKLPAHVVEAETVNCLKRRLDI